MSEPEKKRDILRQGETFLVPSNDSSWQQVHSTKRYCIVDQETGKRCGIKVKKLVFDADGFPKEKEVEVFLVDNIEDALRSMRFWKGECKQCVEVINVWLKS